MFDRDTLPRFVLLLVFAISVSVIQLSLPSVQAVSCQMQITNVDFPIAVGVGEKLNVKTALTVTCTSSIDIVSGRIDLVDQTSGGILSARSFDVGVIYEQKRTVNVTVTNGATSPSAPTLWNLRVDILLFHGTNVVETATQSFQIQVGTVVQTTTSSTSPTLATTTSATSDTVGPPPVGTFGVVGIIAAVAVVSSALVFMRRRKLQTTIVKQETVPEEIPLEVFETKPVSPAEPIISTGYAELDDILAGGIPVGYSILIVSPPCDEKDLLFRRIVESCLSTGRSIFFVSRDLGRTRDLANRYAKNFYALSPQADKITGDHGNIFKIAAPDSLNDVNITLNKAMEPLLKENPNRIIIMDILTDVLLQHKALTTRRWLDDLIGKRKAEGFTILGTLNPLIVPQQDSQSLIDLFDGIIEIYEKEFHERARRFLIVKKMYARKYTETELMLDKDKLF